MNRYRTLLLTALMFFCAQSYLAAGLTGVWDGSISVGVQQLRLVFHITEQPAGTLAATLDVPAQGATGLRCSEATLGEGGIVNIAIASIGASFGGVVSASGDTIVGQFYQSGMTLPLSLARRDLSGRQEPVPPFPYESRQVTFGHDGVTLAGTLTLPAEGKGPFPAVLLVSGSGPQDRDETIAGHKPFLVIADHLTRRGVAVLRYDDRGVGGSSIASGYETTEDFARDALSGIEWLKKCDEIDSSRVGMLGHSEGGAIAIASAQRCAFIVTLAAPAVKGKDLMIEQNRMMVQAGGGAWTPELARQVTDVFTAIDTAGSKASLKARLREIAGDDAALKAQIPALTSPWYVHFVKHDPTAELGRVRCPMLAIGGEWDAQVACEQNLGAIRAHVPTATVLAMPRLNHLLQECQSQAESVAYGDIVQTISPQVLAEIGQFIGRVTEARP